MPGTSRSSAARSEGIPASVLELLEFTKVRDWLASLTSAPTSAELALALEPATDAESVHRRLAELAEGKRLAETDGPWPGPPPFPATDLLGEGPAPGATLPARALFGIAELLAAAERAARYWQKARAAAPHAADLGQGIVADPELERRIRVSVGADGEVLDSASGALAAVRKEQGVVRNRLRDRLERYRAVAAEDDSFVTQRNERFVVAVRADRFVRSKGLVHDVSASGATLFVEPFEICALNNELAEAAARERNEIARVLAALTELVRARTKELRATEAALAATDLLWARIRLSRALAGHTPQVTVKGRRLALTNARHPLLWRDAGGATDAAAAARTVVPLALELAAPRRVLLVSGPNMGGKTVALKTVGLAALMAQAGLDVPADEGVELPLFTDVQADIGDAQSIEAHLSTFAAHLRRLDRMAKSAGPNALFLVDEIGAGTDPAEGAALGRALLRHFARAGSWAVATTHLGSLKALAQEEKAVQNASMALDPVTLEPRFELLVGVPGGSHALRVAERLGFHAGVLAEATRDLPEAARSLEGLLADVAAELTRAREARRSSEQQEERARAAEAAFAAEREALMDGLRARGRDRLHSIRALEGQVSALLRELRAESKSEARSRERIQELEARSHVLGRESDRLVDQARPGGEPADILPGATVFVRDLGVTAKVLEGPDAEGRVILERGAWRIQSQADQCLAPPAEAEAGGRAGRAGRAGPGAGVAGRRVGPVSVPESEPALDIDVRGLDQEDALRRLDEGLDRAVLAGLEEIRIVHGVGRGVLRDAIARALRTHPHVAKSRLGEFGEGGRGVTVARLR